MSPFRDRIFYAVCFGFIFGVFVRSFVYIDLYRNILFCTLSIVLVFLFFFLLKNKWLTIIGFFILLFFVGILRFNLFNINPSDFLEERVGKTISVEGLVVDDPEIKENNQKLIFSPRTDIGEEGKILVSVDFTEEYKYGDIINISGKLEKPENFITDYGKDFDYVNYLKKDGILYVMGFPDVEIISRNNGNYVKRNLFNIKEKFLEKINFSIKKPESLLMGGLILGEKTAFSDELRQSFINTGTIHIVALSGYNVTIIAEWIMKLFSFLPNNIGIGLGISSIILFILMTGASSTAIRSGIMAVLVLVARATGRNYDVARALILAAFLMVIINPLILVYDVSFQLSFIATIAVIFITPRLEKYFLWVTKNFGLRDIFSVTCSAYVFVLPFILYKMGTFSVVSFPVNILILPFIPLTMMFGFFTGIIGFVSYILALPFGLISYIFLHYELFVINLFSDFPFSSFVIPNFPLIFTILIYLYFIYRIFGKSIKSFFTKPL
jgi:competence protein ComEC